MYLGRVFDRLTLQVLGLLHAAALEDQASIPVFFCQLLTQFLLVDLVLLDA